VDAVPPLDPQQLRVHAAHLDALRARFGPIRSASQQIAQDQAAFGPFCGRILTGLRERHARQDELIAYVEENLFLIASGLRRVADGQSTLAALVGVGEAEPAGGSDVEPAGDDTATADHPQVASPEAGRSGDESAGRPGSEIVAKVISAIQGREWVHHFLADAAPVAEFATPATDSFTALRAGALQWALAYIPPVRQVLDDLTGMPDLVAAHATIWRGISGDLHRIATDLQAHLHQDVPQLPRPDVRGYLAMMSRNVDALTGLAEISTAMALITKAAGDLILLARDIIRGLIADLVTRIVIWLVEDPVVPLQVTAWRLTTVVATCWRLQTYTTALFVSLMNLSDYVDG